jgi:RNA polymerase sigma factor (sigma-70 family)
MQIMKTRRTLLNEEQLIEAIKIQNRIGAEALYERYSKSLYGFLFKMVNNQELAEDLLQQAFVKIWNSIDNYDTSKGRLFTWMMAITRNIAGDFLRNKLHNQRVATGIPETYLSDIDQHNTAVLNTDTIGMKALVDNLKNNHKVILNLIYYKGYTHTEVAEELGIPLGIVKTNCRKAICLLRGIYYEPSLDSSSAV